MIVLAVSAAMKVLPRWGLAGLAGLSCAAVGARGYDRQHEPVSAMLQEYCIQNKRFILRWDRRLWGTPLLRRVYKIYSRQVNARLG